MLAMLQQTINRFWKISQKISSTIKIIHQKQKTIEKINIIDLKSVTTEYPKTSSKLAKTIRQAKDFSQLCGAGKNSTSSLYIETTKSEIFFDKKL